MISKAQASWVLCKSLLAAYYVQYKWHPKAFGLQMCFWGPAASRGEKAADVERKGLEVQEAQVSNCPRDGRDSGKEQCSLSRRLRKNRDSCKF